MSAPNRTPIFASTLALFVLWTSMAWSRAEERLSYTKAQSYRSALRYLRVEQGYEILEKDMESGYLLFKYPRTRASSPDAPVVHGSVEVIEREQETALVVQLPDLPSYHERLLIEGLLDKLKADYGAPPIRRAPEPPSRPVEREDEKDDDPPTEQPETESP